MPNPSSALAASRMISRSESLPMTIATCGLSLMFVLMSAVVPVLLPGRDRNQLNFEDQCAVGRDVAVAGAAFAVGKLRRNKELPLRSDRHQLQRFGPAFDDAVHGKARRLAAAIGTVKFLAVDQNAAII